MDFFIRRRSAVSSPGRDKYKKVGFVFEFFEGRFRFLRSQGLKYIWIPWMFRILCLNIFQVHCDRKKGF